MPQEFNVIGTADGMSLKMRARTQQVGTLFFRANNQYHGTCMLGLLGGAIKGVSSNISPVLVTLNLNDGKEMFTVALDWILHDYSTARPSGNPLAVLSMSLGYMGIAGDHPWRIRVETVLQDLVQIGVLPVAATGNDNAVSNRFRIRKQA